jgi:hypothetical protein
MSEGVVNMFVLDTVDSVATATGAGYVSDAGPTAVLPGRGMRIGDVVIVRVVGAIPTGGEPPASCTDQAWCYCSAVNASTGAGTLVLTHTNA